MGSSVASTTGSFIIDSSLGRYTRFGIYVEDEDDHLIKSVAFRDGQGVQYGPYTSMASTYDNINLKVVNFPVGQEPPFDQVRILVKHNELENWIIKSTCISFHFSSFFFFFQCCRCILDG